MAVWEYKVISSGKGGFATPALLETFLNQLGKDEWEIIHFQSPTDNALAFTGLARRSTQRDWTLEDAAAAAARAEADKLRAEFEAKFKGAGAGPAADEKPESIAAEKAAADDGFRKPRDTESDLDPEAAEEAGEPDEWDKLGGGEELPTFFEAIQPLMRRNQRGLGLSVGLDHLAKKWNLSEDEVLGALKECGFAIPEDEDAKPAYVEYDGDLYWVNVNRRGEIWINAKETPRPVFRIVAGNKVADPAPEAGAAPTEVGAAPASGEREPDHEAARPPRGHDADRRGPEADRRGRGPDPKGRKPGQGGGSGGALPEGPALLQRIRPLMRYNRGAPGGSGSVGFLSRALKCRENDLTAAFATLGLVLPEAGAEAPPPVTIGDRLWWLNRDPRGAIWINDREVKADGSAAEPAPAAPADEAIPPGNYVTPAPADSGSDPAPSAPALDGVLPALRLLLKETRTGALAGEIGRLAETLGKGPEEVLGTLIAVGLKAPEKPREKPVFVEHAGEIFWLNRNAKGELWLNAKASKYASDGADEKEGASRSRRGRPATAASEPSAPPQSE
jgi:hypothetical protein